MALNIPRTNSSAPSQSAPVGPDPERAFGSVVATPGGMPSVPNGMGGLIVDRSAEVNGFNKIQAALGGIVDDVEAKEKALRRANETLKMVEASQSHQQDWFEKQQAIKRSLYSGDMTPEQANEQANKDIQELNTKYFGADNYADEDMKIQAKIHAVEISGKSTRAFKTDVIMPYQTSKYRERLDNIVNQAVQVTSDAGRLGNSDDVMNAYLANRQNIENVYKSTEANMMFEPEQLVKEYEKKIKANAIAVIDGILARDFVSTDGKYDPIKGAEIKIASIKIAQDLLNNNPQLRQDIGDNVDNVMKNLEESKARNFEAIQRQQDINERRAERLRKQAERAQFAKVYEDLVKGGVESKYMNEDSLVRLGLDPALTTQLIEKKRAIERGELNYDQSFRYVENMIKTGSSMARPDKQSAEYLNNHFRVLTRSPDFKALPPDQQAAMIASSYGKVGWLPDDLKNNITKSLRSNDPRVVDGALIILRKMENVNPSVLEGLSPEEKAMYRNVKDGTPITAALEIRNKALYKNPEQAKIDEKTYREKMKVDKDYEAYERNKADFESKLRSEYNSWLKFEFRTPVVTKSMIEGYDKKVQEYAPLVNFDIDKARELAFKDMTKHTGVSEVTGKRVVMQNAPEKVYRGVSPAAIQKQFKETIKEVKKENPDLAKVPDEDFGLITDPTYSSSTPLWKITVKTAGDLHVPVTINGYGGAYFQYDPSKEVKEAQQKQEAEINKAKADRAKNVEKQKKAPKSIFEGATPEKMYVTPANAR